LKSALEKSLKRLRTDCLDLIQIHNPTLEDIERGEVFELFQDFQKQGLIKFWGVSLRQPSDGLKAIAKASQLRVDLATIQVAFNVFQRQAKDKLFELADKHNVGLIVREPLCRGFLSGKYDIAEDFETHAVVKFLNENKALPEDILKAFDQVQKIFKKYNRPEDPVQLALKYILSFNQVGTVIPGAKNISQARQNLTSFELPDFEPELLAELNNFSQQFAYTM
ncbi:MAG TPA: aldo/keto reductase, partial [Patescibacteria group bacterium]